jgi:hypothetical protein
MHPSYRMLMGSLRDGAPDRTVLRETVAGTH